MDFWGCANGREFLVFGRELETVETFGDVLLEPQGEFWSGFGVGFDHLLEKHFCGGTVSGPKNGT
jgi:hypothetical protein